MTYRPTTSSETAAAFLESYTARQVRRRSGRPWRNEGWKNETRVAFHETVLSKIGRLVPKGTMRILDDVREDWGTVHRSRVSRALDALVAEGKIVRTDGGFLLVRVRRTA